MAYKTLIFDGNNLLFRAFFSRRPDNIVNGINTTPIFQLLNMVKANVKRFKPSKVVFTWDKRLDESLPNFRKETVPYKEQRVENVKSEEIHGAIEHIQKFLDALGVETIYPLCMEADDVIRYAARHFEGPTLMISSDKDLLQLIKPDVHLLFPSKDIIVTLENFEEVATVAKEHFILYKAILGDSSDNIKGLDKFGPVRAKALAENITKEMNFYDTELIDDEQRRIIKRNILVMNLKFTEDRCPAEYKSYKEQTDSFRGYFETDRLKDLFLTYDMRVFLNSFGEWNNLFNHQKNDSDLLSQLVM